MADTFFGFNTTLTGSLEDELTDEPGQGLEDEDEEEYDALNDETFGDEAVEGDWEEDHEKLAEITEQSRLRQNSLNNDSNIESDDHADLDLEASISQLVLDDFDDLDLENGEATKPESGSSRHFPSSNSGIDLIDSSSYSSSAPSGYSVWGVVKPDTQPQKLSAQTILPGVKKVCTVEELERDLISKRNAAVQPPGFNKSSTGMRLQDVERDTTTSSSGVGSTNFSVVNLGLGRGQSTPFPPQDVVAMRNTQNAAAVPSIGRGGNVAHFPPQLAGPTPQPVLGLGRGVAPNPAFVLSPRLLGPHPAALGIPDLRQLQQQNHRLMGSAPNIVGFIPPHLVMQSQQALRDGGKSMGPQAFPTENGILHPLHQHRSNIAYRPNFQNPLVDQQRMPIPNQFPVRPDHMAGRHFVNNRASNGNFNQHPGHRVHYNSHYNNYNNYRHHHHQMENGSGDHDDYAGLMTNREKQWLLNIQLIQLNTSQPYVDDYYYTVFTSRQQKKDNKQGDTRQRERRDSHRDREQRSDQQSSSKVYTPAQFENSLGKLQVGSVTAPRKIIDMDVVSPEGLDSTLQSLQRDSRKAKQLLLEIERLYLLILQVEDLLSPVPEVRELVTEDKADLLHKIITSLVIDDRLTSFMCIHKGKLLMLRVLPHLIAEYEEEGNCLTHIWCTIFRGLVTIGKRDQTSEESLLPRFYPHFKTWLGQNKFPALLEVAQSMVPGSSRTVSPVIPSKNVLVYALGNKFGISSIAAMLEQAEVLYSTLEEKHCHDWSSFLTRLAEALGAIASPDSLPSPLEPMDATVLTRHLGRCSGLCIEKYAVLEQIFARHYKVDLENKENRVNS